MEKYSIQIEIALNTVTHISITMPLFSREVPSEEQINDLISKTLNKDSLDNITYKSVVIRL